MRPGKGWAMDSETEMKAAAVALAACFMDSWNNRDGPAYGSAYWEDAELVDPTGAIWDGRDAIEAMHVALWRGPGRATLVAAEVRRIRPLSDTLMVADLDVAVTGFFPPPPGALQHPNGSVETHLKHVVEKRAGQWKILASQNTFVAMPPPATGFR